MQVSTDSRLEETLFIAVEVVHAALALGCRGSELDAELAGVESLMRLTERDAAQVLESVPGQQTES